MGYKIQFCFKLCTLKNVDKLKWSFLNGKY